MFTIYRPFAGAALLALSAWPARAQNSALLETVIVTGKQTQADVPSKIETVDAATASRDINAVDTEDMLKYMPSILVRKRHYGDTQDPLSTRTSGVGASARSLVFVDGILISSPIGNNNTTASPHFGIAAPEDVASLDVLYGPFAAEYGGGSIGAVLNITTAMPDHLEIYADALGAEQDFRLYGHGADYGTGQVGVGIGDRDGAFAWRLSANHLDTTGQPLAVVSLGRPAAPGNAGEPVTGGIANVNRTGAPITILGAGGIEHQVEDTDTAKLAYDFTGLEADYTVSLFHQTDNATAQSYLRDGAGDPVYAGAVNDSGYSYAIGASAFSNNVYNWHQTHLAQALSLKSTAGGAWRWEMVASDYAYLADDQRVPGTALPAAMTGGAGTITRLGGTGWYTLDAKAMWDGGSQQLSFGAHRDAERFIQRAFQTADWRGGPAGALATEARGRTATDALWVQDIWSFALDLKAILGARAEDWQAGHGYNYVLAPALDVRQPALSARAVSPKASLAWQADDAWALTASWGAAYRMPTVTELYQAITTGTQFTVPDPDLRPEHADSFELAAERRTAAGRLRLSLFDEEISNALLSQSAPLVAGSATLYSYVQNVNRTQVRGAELVAQRNDVLPGLSLSGSLTYSDGHIVRDTGFPAANGKFIPQLPKLRGTASATWRPDDVLAFTLAARYSDRAFGTIDNSDPVSQTFQGFGEYLVLDARAHLDIDANWSAAIGVDNLNDDRYFLYHPFPQRTLVFEIHYAQ